VPKEQYVPNAAAQSVDHPVGTRSDINGGFAVRAAVFEQTPRRVIDRLRRCVGNVLLFGHRDMSRVMAARWLEFPALEGRRFYLDPGSLSLLGYDHTTSEPVIRLWNEGAP